MPNTYVRKALREREAKIKKSGQTLLAICDDSTASPETKLRAVRLLKPIQELQEQLSTKDEQISRKDEEAGELKRQLKLKSEALEAVEKKLQTALKENKCNEEKIDELKTDYGKLAHEREDFDERIANIEEEKNAALDRAKKAEAEAEKLVGSLKILADEFVPPQDRRSTGLRQLKAHGTTLSIHWYLLLDIFNALRHERELEQLRKQMAEAKKQERPVGPGILYETPDHAEFFGGIFLYLLLVERDRWLEESLIDFFRSEGVDYLKWLSWENGEASAANDEWKRKRFLRIRQEHDTVVRQGFRLLSPIPP
jgi:chromosome segregation ATPase